MRVQGLLLHAYVSPDAASGDRPAVVMLYGLNVSGRTMLPTAEQLAADCRTYMPDLPGCGESEKPKHALPIPDLAEVLVAWMGAVGLERAVFITISSQAVQ